MKVKFNLFERVAGVFVLTAFAIAIGVTIGIGVKKGWFESKIHLKTYVSSADGIRAGTSVQLAGLEVGSVDDIDLQPGQQVEIKFRIFEKFTSQIRSDSKVKILRPFIIGEKVLELTSGTADAAMIKDGQTLSAEYAPDFLEFLGGNKLGAYMQTINGTMENLQKLANAFLSDERSADIIELFDKMLPLMDEMNVMAVQVGQLSKALNKDDKFEETIVEMLALSKEMNTSLPGLTKGVPTLTKNMNGLTTNLNQLISDFQRMVPVIEKMAPEIPGASKTLIQAMNETVITLKAMQKTIFLRGSVREVLEEEGTKVRKPASQ